MYLAYGSYSWATGVVWLAKSVTTEFGDTGRPMSQTHTINCKGTLFAANQAAMTTAILLMEAALRIPNQNLILYNDDGSASSLILPVAGSLTGVRVISGPNYPTTDGNENAGHRTWEATFQSKYALSTSSANLVTRFTETVEVSGGEPQYVVKPNKYGPFQRQLNYPQMPWIASQRGQATGYRGYPPVPPPIWPQAKKEGVKVSRTGPRQDGYFLTDYGISWEYQYESTTPLVGLPTFWTNPP